MKKFIIGCAAIVGLVIVVLVGLFAAGILNFGNVSERISSITGKNYTAAEYLAEIDTNVTVFYEVSSKIDLNKLSRQENLDLIADSISELDKIATIINSHKNVEAKGVEQFDAEVSSWVIGYKTALKEEATSAAELINDKGKVDNKNIKSFNQNVAELNDKAEILTEKINTALTKFDDDNQ